MKKSIVVLALLALLAPIAGLQAEDKAPAASQVCARRHGYDSTSAASTKAQKRGHKKMGRKHKEKVETKTPAK